MGGVDRMAWHRVIVCGRGVFCARSGRDRRRRRCSAKRGATSPRAAQKLPFGMIRAAKFVQRILEAEPLWVLLCLHRRRGIGAPSPLSMLAAIPPQSPCSRARPGNGPRQVEARRSASATCGLLSCTNNHAYFSCCPEQPRLARPRVRRARGILQLVSRTSKHAHEENRELVRSTVEP